jgi:hypothetical protein
MGMWMHSSTILNRHYTEVSGQLHAPAALLPQDKAADTHRMELIGPRARHDAVQ